MGILGTIANVATGGGYNAVKSAIKGDYKGAVKSVVDPLGIGEKTLDYLGDKAGFTDTDTSQIDADRKRSEDLFNQYMSEASNRQAFNAPQFHQSSVSGVNNIQAGQVQGPGPIQVTDPGAARTVGAERVSDPGQIQVFDPGAARGVTSREVGAPMFVSPDTIMAPDAITAERIASPQQIQARAAEAMLAGPAAQATASSMQAAAIDPSLAGRNVSRQDNALSLLESAAAGKAPSAAEAQLNLGADKNAAAALAIARGGKGSQQASNIRQALRNIAEQGFQTNMGAAALRADEMAKSRGQLSAAVGDARGTDTTLAVKDADLRQGANSQNAQLATNVSQSNAGLRSATDIENARLGTTTRLAGAANDLSAQTANAANQVTVGQANAANNLTAQTATAGNQLSAATSNAANSLTASTGNANRANATEIANADRALAADSFTAGAANTRDQFTAGLKTAASTQDVANQIAVNTGNADRVLRADTSSADAVNRRGEFTAGLTTAAATQDATNLINVNTGNADRTLRADTTNTGNQLAAQTTNATLRQDAEKSNQQATIQGQQINNQALNSDRQAMLDAQQGIQTSTGQKFGVEAGDRDRAQKTIGAGFEAAGSLLAPKSDARAKTGIRGESTEKLDEMLEHLRAVAFDYKPGEGPRGLQHGIVADDLEKSDIGKDLVFRDSRGMKRVDGAQTIMALLGVAAEQNRRLKKLEATR
jgi:hypothetical protein